MSCAPNTPSEQLQIINSRAGKFFSEDASDTEDENAMAVEPDAVDNSLVLSNLTDSSSNSNNAETQQNNSKKRKSAESAAALESAETFSKIDLLMKQFIIDTIKKQFKDMVRLNALEMQISKCKNHLKTNTLPTELQWKPLKYQYLQVIPDIESHQLAEQKFVVECQKNVLNYRLKVNMTQFEKSKGEFLLKYDEANMQLEYDNLLAPYRAQENIDLEQLVSVAKESLAKFLITSKLSLKDFKQKVNDKAAKLSKKNSETSKSTNNNSNNNSKSDDNASANSTPKNNATRQTQLEVVTAKLDRLTDFVNARLGGELSESDSGSLKAVKQKKAGKKNKADNSTIKKN